MNLGKENLLTSAGSSSGNLKGLGGEESANAREVVKKQAKENSPKEFKVS